MRQRAISPRLAKSSLSEISPNLFDLLDAYANEIAAGQVTSGGRVRGSSLVLTFCQNFFNQFFVAEYGHQITGFDDKDAEAVAPLRRQAGHSPEARALVALFLRFCRDYPDIVGAGYASAPWTSKLFHTKYLVRLIDRAEMWSNVRGDADLVARIAQAKVKYRAAIESVQW